MGRKPKTIKPPKWLDEIATAEFKRIEKLLREEEKDFTQKDIKSLEAYATNYSKWQRAEMDLLKNGMVIVVNDDGYEQARPEVAISNKAQQEMRSWAKELGLTPSARTRMKIVQAKTEDTDDEMEGYVSK